MMAPHAYMPDVAPPADAANTTEWLQFLGREGMAAAMPMQQGGRVVG